MLALYDKQPQVVNEYSRLAEQIMEMSYTTSGLGKPQPAATVHISHKEVRNSKMGMKDNLSMHFKYFLATYWP